MLCLLPGASDRICRKLLMTLARGSRGSEQDVPIEVRPRERMIPTYCPILQYMVTSPESLGFRPCFLLSAVTPQNPTSSDSAGLCSFTQKPTPDLVLLTHRDCEDCDFLLPAKCDVACERHTAGWLDGWIYKLGDARACCGGSTTVITFNQHEKSSPRHILAVAATSPS